MLARIIFCVAVLLATLIVILLALFSPLSHRKPSNNHPNPPWLDLSLYIQHPHIPNPNSNTLPISQTDAGAFIFRRTLTEGPENTSRIVGKAQGFIIPVEQFADSAFNILYLSFDMPEYRGSLSVQAKRVAHKDGDELTVVGGTGSFAFARGLAVLAQTSGKSSEVDATYHVKLQLRFPNQSHRTIPG